MVSAAELDEQITSLIRRFLAEAVGRPDEEITDDTDFIADLMLDSLDFVALIGEIESRWGLRVPPDTGIRSLGTVGAVRGFVHEALAGVG